MILSGKDNPLNEQFNKFTTLWEMHIPNPSLMRGILMKMNKLWKTLEFSQK